MKAQPLHVRPSQIWGSRDRSAGMKQSPHRLSILEDQFK